MQASIDAIFGPEAQDTEPRPLFDGGAHLRAKVPLLKQLDVFGYPANVTVSEDHFKALSIERGRTLEDALADGEVRIDADEPMQVRAKKHRKHHKKDKKDRKDKKDETVVEEQPTPTNASSSAAHSVHFRWCSTRWRRWPETWSGPGPRPTSPSSPPPTTASTARRPTTR